MLKQRKNFFLSFLASARLALVLLALLAAGAALGSFIPQNAPQALYVERYGPGWTRLFEFFAISALYTSWWFLGLLALLSLNLLLCSLRRLHGLLRFFKQDRLDLTKEQLARFEAHALIEHAFAQHDAEARIRRFFGGRGLRVAWRRSPEGTLFYATKGAWSRFGVYLTHLSILVILLGALLGAPGFGRNVLKKNDFAYQGLLVLPEKTGARHLNRRDGGQVDLGFTLYCEQFDLSCYDNGMPRSYRSRMRIEEEGRPAWTQDIEVNKPMKYKGIMFYQASYQPLASFYIRIQKEPEHLVTEKLVEPEREIGWQEAGLSFGLLQVEGRGAEARRVKLWLSDGKAEPAALWLEMNEEKRIERPDGSYTLSVKQRYATGLQVAKDPGVGLVYAGCLLMLFGLYTCFFAAHHEFFAFLEAQGPVKDLHFAGRANKNKRQFRRIFQTMAARLRSEAARK